jgi:hypothetical protein
LMTSWPKSRVETSRRLEAPLAEKGWLKKMSEVKKEIDLLGIRRTVADVPILKSSEHFQEYELEDGSFLRVKPVATAILRVEGAFNAEGKPVYLVMLSPSTYVVSSSIKPDLTPLIETPQ